MKIFDWLRKKPSAPSTEQIVPRIKHENFLAAVRDMGVDEASTPVTEPYVADLLITYAFDLPHTFQMLAEQDRQRLNLSVDSLRSTAIANLRQTLPRVERRKHGPLLMLAAGGDVEACLLLLDEIWDGLKNEVSPPLVVAVPTRDIILVTSGESEQGLYVMREASEHARQNEQVHCLTEHLLMRQEDGWQVFNG